MLVYMQCRNNFHNDSKCRKKLTQCQPCYTNTTKLHVSVAAAIICTILGLRICLIKELTWRKKNHSKILPSPTYIEITKNSTGPSLFIPNVAKIHLPRIVLHVSVVVAVTTVVLLLIISGRELERRTLQVDPVVKS